jgi:hypothetical protein
MGPYMQNLAIRGILIFSGTLSLAVGIVGVFVPILPTTPFLLFSAACYTKSSKRFHTWLLNNRIFGNYIRNYQEGNGIARNIKALTVSLLWATILFSIMFMVSNTLVRSVLFVIAIYVTVHILSLKTLEEDTERAQTD